MLISRKRTLKELRQEPKEKFSIRISARELAKFSKTCAKDGKKTFSPVLENLLTQFLEKANNGMAMALPPYQKKSDRATKGFICSPNIFANFKKKCKNLKAKMPHVLELLINDYMAQSRKDHASKKN